MFQARLDAGMTHAAALASLTDFFRREAARHAQLDRFEAGDFT